MKNHTWSGRLFDIINVAIMLVIIVFTFYPFLYVLSYSLSDPVQVGGGLLLLPRGLNFDSYEVAFSNSAVLKGLLVSVGRTVVGSIATVIVTSMAAYCVTRSDMVGVRWMRKYFVFTMYFSSGMIPVYLMVKALHLPGTFWVYIIPGAISVFNMILIKTYIEQLPDSLEEAAIVDGANDLTRFWRIVFPLCMPVVSAVTLFCMVDQWNSFFDTQIYNLMYPNLFPLQYVLYQTLASISSIDQIRSNAVPYATSPQSLKMAITMITVIPILFVYPILQRHFVKGLLVGAIKG